MKLIFTLLLTLSITVFGPAAAAETTISQVPITSNSYEDTLPRIKGDYLVWQGYVGGDWEIFLYNIATQETLQITDNHHDDLSPQTDGHSIVWQGFDGSEWDVFLWDGSQIQPISDPSSEDVCPQIANGRVVWTAEPFGDDFVGPSEVVLYDVGTHTKTVLSASADVDPGNTMDDCSPKINHEVVLWLQSDEEDNGALYMYDLGTGSITKNPDYDWRDSPQKDGKLTALIRHDGHDREIFVYSSDSKRYYQITDNDLQDGYPGLSQNYIAWMAGGEIFLAALKHLALISPKDHAVLSEHELPTFRWEHIGYHEFKLEFSADSVFPKKGTSVLPSKEKEWLSESPFAPTEKEWDSVKKKLETKGRVYWRVIAKDRNGKVSVSQTWRFTFVNDQRKGANAGLTSIDQVAPGVATTGDDGNSDTAVGVDAGDGGRSSGSNGSCFIHSAGG